MISLRKGELATGSARSFAGFDLYSGLNACSEHLVGFGGHRAAAGVRLRPELIEDFRNAFAEYVSNNHTITEQHLQLQVDAEVRLADVTHRAVRELQRLGPFGEKNRRPRFAATNVELPEAPRTMGEGDRHLSLRVRHYGTTMRAIAFGRGEWAEEIAKAEGPLSICFAPTINSFQGRERVELQLIDWQSGATETARDEEAKEALA